MNRFLQYFAVAALVLVIAVAADEEESLKINSHTHALTTETFPEEVANHNVFVLYHSAR